MPSRDNELRAAVQHRDLLAKAQAFNESSLEDLIAAIREAVGR